jgi:hypothetical protein
VSAQPILPEQAPQYRFDADKHRHYVGDETTIGVTTAVNYATGDTSGLEFWQAKVAAEWALANPDFVGRDRSPDGVEKAARYMALKADEVRDAAATLGTEVHDAINDLLWGVEVEYDPQSPAGRRIEAWWRFVDEWALAPVATADSRGVLAEFGLVHTGLGYAGRGDAIVSFGRGPLAGAIVAVDWKNTSKPAPKTALQLAAYSRAEWLYPDGGCEPMRAPHVDATMLVHITEDTATGWPMATSPAQIDEAFEEFTWCLRLAQTERRRKARVKHPMGLMTPKFERRAS